MTIKFYTDGACSKNPGIGGWAIAYLIDGKCKTLSGREKDTTNNRMELTAFLKALQQIIILSKHKNYDYELYSDSAYVVNTVNEGWLTKWVVNGWKTKAGKEVKNKDLLLLVDKCLALIKQKEIKLSIIKVKGHSGNEFNELVDKIAKVEVNKLKEK